MDTGEEYEGRKVANIHNSKHKKGNESSLSKTKHITPKPVSRRATIKSKAMLPILKKDSNPFNEDIFAKMGSQSNDFISISNTIEQATAMAAMKKSTVTPIKEQKTQYRQTVVGVRPSTSMNNNARRTSKINKRVKYYKGNLPKV